MSNASRFAALVGLAASIPLVGTHSHAAEVMATKTLGAYRVDLHVLPAEPYVTKDEVASKHVTAGMEIEGGAPPVMPDAATHPNHHLFVYVLDKKTGHALTNATIAMKFAPAGKPDSTAVDVPIVIMQMIAMGPEATHWGNNVTMPDGRYQVTVNINGEIGTFNVKVSDAPSSMPVMGKMKM
jgi:hypothetical protein